MLSFYFILNRENYFQGIPFNIEYHLVFASWLDMKPAGRKVAHGYSVTTHLCAQVPSSALWFGQSCHGWCPIKLSHCSCMSKVDQIEWIVEHMTCIPHTWCYSIRCQVSLRDCGWKLAVWRVWIKLPCANSTFGSLVKSLVQPSAKKLPWLPSPALDR